MKANSLSVVVHFNDKTWGKESEDSQRTKTKHMRKSIHKDLSTESFQIDTFHPFSTLLQSPLIAVIHAHCIACAPHWGQPHWLQWQTWFNIHITGNIASGEKMTCHKCTLQRDLSNLGSPLFLRNVALVLFNFQNQSWRKLKLYIYTLK